ALLLHTLSLHDALPISAENEARIEDEIDDVRDPQQAHGDGCVAGPAKDSVVEKEHHDNATAAERDARITGACSDDLRRRTHQARSEEHTSELQSLRHLV